MRIAVQLYTLREYAEVDFMRMLQEVAAMGYEGVEFAGFYDIPKEDMRNALKRLNLKAAAAHVRVDLLENNIDEIIDYNAYIGNHNIVIPGLEMETLTQAEQCAKRIKPIIDTLSKHSMRVSYHNHNHEFVLENGEYLLDRFYSSLPANELFCEMDTYWIKRADIDPSTYIRRYGSRCPLLHLKDLPTDRKESDFTSVGYGVMDIPSILDAAKDIKTEWLIVEDDNPKPDGMTSIRKSIRYLHSHLDNTGDKK